jgi:hypothetical protein
MYIPSTSTMPVSAVWPRSATTASRGFMSRTQAVLQATSSSRESWGADLPFTDCTEKAITASILRKLSLWPAKIVPLVAENSRRHSLARDLKVRPPFRRQAPAQPQCGQ